MKTKDKKNLAKAMQEWLALKELTATQEKQMEALKGEILAIALANKADFADEELVIDGAGLLKWVNTPAKVVFVAGNKTLNDIELLGLAKELGGKYEAVKRGLNMARLKIAVDQQDREVMGVLLSYGVKVLQQQRLDVKAVQ